jgi:hypothetical protein
MTLTNKQDLFTEYTTCSLKDCVIFGGWAEYIVVSKWNVHISFGEKTLIFLIMYYSKKTLIFLTVYYFPKYGV